MQHLLLPAVLTLGGVIVGLAGYLGLTERLPRNRFVGLRTPTTMRGDAAFRAANKAAGAPTLLGGTIAVAGGTAAWFIPTDGALLAVVIGTSVAMLPPILVGVLRGVDAAKAAEREN
ncbi:SdpI family protein [Saccharothrix texasensis]|uniref:SdpI/YhfL family protein n=1 Tax=Saccharothrix texasensis TaxID=103734 RepID=A0A3N1HCD5_9PSEU|nr:SdpI family protein [Saccharothrix texasensis]ROP40151.1 SdpI/YhfL family protein [Saccharothrix texasensis]